MKHKFMGIICMLTLSCQNVQPNIQQVKNIPESNKLKSFNKKAFDSTTIFGKRGSFSNDDLGIKYTGAWIYGTPTGIGNTTTASQNINSEDYINDISGGFSARLSENKKDFFFNTFDYYNVMNPNLVINGTNSSVTSNISSVGKYIVMNNEQLLMDESNPSSRLMYNPPPNSGTGSFSQTNNFYSSDGKPIFIENDGISNNINTISNLSYNGVSRLNGSLPFNWKEKSNYTYSYDKNSNITFNFYGTNVEIFGNKGINTIWNDLKISLYKESTPNNFNVLVSEVTGLTNDAINQTGSVYKFKALPMAKYMVKLESKSPNKSTGKVSFLYGFDKACVYPSIQYKLPNISNKNAIYQSASYGTAGQVEITIDNDLSTTLTKDLYSVYNKSSPNYVDTHTFVDRNLGSENHHLMTIESLGKNSVNNSNPNATEISLRKFNKMPEISSNFSRNNLPLSVIKGSNYGKVDLYVNNKFVRNIDLFNSSLISSLELIENSNFNENTNTFKLISSHDYNKTSGKLTTTFDSFINAKHKVEFEFSARGLGDLVYICSRASDRGKVKAKLYNINDVNNPVLYRNQNSDVDLYTPINYYGEGKRFHNWSFSDILPAKYRLLIEPTFEKNADSSDYLIDISEVKFLSLAQVDANSSDQAANNFDSVCTP